MGCRQIYEPSSIVEAQPYVCDYGNGEIPQALSIAMSGRADDRVARVAVKVQLHEHEHVTRVRSNPPRARFPIRAWCLRCTGCAVTTSETENMSESHLSINSFMKVISANFVKLQIATSEACVTFEVQWYDPEY